MPLDVFEKNNQKVSQPCKGNHFFGMNRKIRKPIFVIHDQEEYSNTYSIVAINKLTPNFLKFCCVILQICAQSSNIPSLSCPRTFYNRILTLIYHSTFYIISFSNSRVTSNIIVNMFMCVFLIFQKNKITRSSGGSI